MLNTQIASKVVLPAWVMEGAQNEFEQLLNAREYINSNNRYPNYKVLSIKDGIALCEREAL